MNQIHDFNPGIDPSGLFWTAALPGDAADADFDDGEASLEVHNLAMDDYFTVEASCRIDLGEPTVVPYTLLPPGA